MSKGRITDAREIKSGIKQGEKKSGNNYTELVSNEKRFVWI
jgi:hypothetical protein